MKKEFRIAILVMLVISVLASGCSKNKSANVYRDSGSYYTEEYEYEDYLADGMMPMNQQPILLKLSRPLPQIHRKFRNKSV